MSSCFFWVYFLFIYFFGRPEHLPRREEGGISHFLLLCRHHDSAVRQQERLIRRSLMTSPPQWTWPLLGAQWQVALLQHDGAAGNTQVYLPIRRLLKHALQTVVILGRVSWAQKILNTKHRVCVTHVWKDNKTDLTWFQFCEFGSQTHRIVWWFRGITHSNTFIRIKSKKVGKNRL